MRVVREIACWLRIAAASLAVLAALWLVAQAALGLKLLDVQTGSMVPQFAPADALVVHETSSLPRVGDVVSYHSSRNPNELVTHRVVAVKGNMLQTKGDAVSSLDPAVRRNLLVGNVIMVFPGFGKVLRWLRSLPGLISCVYAPIAAIAIGELRRLEQHYKRSAPYRLYGHQVV